MYKHDNYKYTRLGFVGNRKGPLMFAIYFKSTQEPTASFYVNKPNEDALCALDFVNPSLLAINGNTFFCLLPPCRSDCNCN